MNYILFELPNTSENFAVKFYSFYQRSPLANRYTIINCNVQANGGGFENCTMYMYKKKNNHPKFLPHQSILRVK